MINLNRPLLEVVTPNFNYAKYLENCLDSIERLNSDQVRHTVIDGKSTDASHNILAEYQKKSKILNWHKYADLNQTDALNFGFSNSVGKWTGWLNSDEFYSTTALSNLLKILKKDSQHDVIFGDAIICDVEGLPIRYKGSHRFDGNVIKRYGPYISTCSFFVRTEFLRNIPSPYMDILNNFSMDWELFLKISELNPRTLYLKYPIGYFRVHPEAKSQNIEKREYSEEQTRIKSRFSIDEAARSAIVRHRILKILDNSYVREAIFKLKNLP